MTINELRSMLQGVKGADAQFTAKCPAHDDNRASLSVSTGNDGRILLNCHAGCDVESIVSALGLTMADIFPRPMEKPQSKTLTATYQYHDETGKLIAEKLRYSDKSFIWRQPDARHEWIYNRRNVPHVLYRLPEVLVASFVCVTEGEKDADTLKRYGYTATTGMDGAGRGKWKPEYTEALRGRDVAVFQDNDDAGKAYAAEVCNVLHTVTKSVKLIDLTTVWADIPNGGDVTDWLKIGDFELGKDMLARLIEFAPPWVPREVPKVRKLKTISARELQKKDIPPVKYVVADMLPQGLSLLASPPKYGKSWLVLDLCLSVAAGHSFLTHQTAKSGCLYLALEDSQHRLKDRMSKILADDSAPECFDYATSASEIGNGLLEELEEYLEDKPNTALIVIDTLQKVRPASTGKENQYSTDYRDIGTLKDFADKRKVCVLLVHHLRKASDDSDPFNRISGTNGILGAVDTALVLTRSKRSDDTTTLSIVGRDVESSDTVLEFRKTTYRWHVIGDAEAIEEERSRREYNDNPIVATIKKLLEQSTNGRWDGTAKELLDAGKCIAKTYLAPTAQKLGYAVKPLDKPLFEYDGIIHTTTSHGNAGKKHCFYYRNIS